MQWLDADDDDALPPFPAYCDMEPELPYGVTVRAPLATQASRWGQVSVLGITVRYRFDTLTSGIDHVSVLACHGEVTFR